MSYASVTDMRARFGPREIDSLLDQDCDGAPDEGRLAAALTDAASEIDAMLALEWDLPLAVRCPLLTGMACDLARSRLHDDEVPKAVAMRASKARAMLRQLRAGGMDLLDANGTLVERRCYCPRTAGPHGGRLR